MTKKMYQRQSKNKSLGQTLTGILIGLILGAIIIAILLFFLNKQRLPQEPQRQTSNVETEIIVPNEAVLPDSASNSISDTMASAVTVVEDALNNWGDMDSDEQKLADEDEGVIVPVTKPSVPSSSLSEKVEPKVTPKPTVKEKERETVSVQTDKNKKPTAEEILEHGSVEKAREAAKKESAPVAKSNESAVKRAKVQAGSFSKAEQADEQRAKLALLGINAHVETGQVNGKTVYRVRTATLSGEKAAQVRKQLQQQGIEAITVGGQ